MSNSQKPVASTLMVVIAFAIVYIVWGSTYFFIRMSIEHIPPMLMGALRFMTAGLLLLLWCAVRGERLFIWRNIRPAIVSGVLLLCTGNGVLIWSEQYLTTSLAAILLASGPIWFVLLDRRNWGENLRSKETITGLMIGIVGVVLLFGDRLLPGLFGSPHPSIPPAAPASSHATTPSFFASGNGQLVAMGILLLGSISWAAGSIYSKYHSKGDSHSVSAGWQMLAAGVIFLPAAWVSGETRGFHWTDVAMSSWLSLIYLITLGSLAGYSAFVWLLQVRSPTQVSTHAYINPVVAVLLGTLFAGEQMSVSQVLGLTVILVSVLLINLAKYRKAASARLRSAEAA
ncbi:MAG: EamA family transporter [Bacteroidota bacterium]|nr:EamA family transporter [Bacteroidota bacterium]